MQNYNKNWIIKDSVIESIQTDPVLYGKVAHALQVKAFSMPKILQAKRSSLTQYAVLYAVSKHLGLPMRELITEQDISVPQEEVA